MKDAMPKAVRVLLPVLFLAAVYSGWAPAELLGSDSDGAAGLMWTTAVLSTGAANVVNAYLDQGDGNPRRLAFWDMLLKLCMIPFHLIVLLGGLIMSIGLAIVPGLIFAIPTMAVMLAAISYGAILFTSSYGFVAAARAQTQGLLNRTSATALIVLHAVFVVDVAAAIALYVMLKKADDVGKS